MSRRATAKASKVDAELLSQAEALVQALHAGDRESAERLIDDLVKTRESALFHDLGKLTRDLHDALNAFREDARLVSVSEVEISDAKERLRYVISMTEQAAHRTLNAVEEGLPMLARIQDGAQQLASDWARFRRRELDVDEFRELSSALEQFLSDSERSSGKLRDMLSDVLMAQDYQDITGQVIRRVIELVEKVELDLVDLVRLSGQRLRGHDLVDAAQTIKGHGPVPPALVGDDVVSGQDQVDDLLSSLGF